MEWLLERFASDPERDSFIHQGRRVRYGAVVDQVAAFAALIAERDIAGGDRVAVSGDYSPEIFCMMLALAIRGAIVIPLSRDAVMERETALAISGCDWLITFDDSGRDASVARHPVAGGGPLLDGLRDSGRPGLLLFSSGSSGVPKAILHDFARVADKFRAPRTPAVAIAFLMIDHFGGINTILAILASRGTVVTVANRSIDAVCEAIEAHHVELLPTTPSFLTMLMTSNLWAAYDLSSLRRITYGTEVMPQSTLDRVRAAFPAVTLQQTYGLSEVGVMQSRSRGDGSLWVRIGGEGFQTRIVDDILWIKSDYAMLGYLNAPSEFDADGWFNTQDRVEVDGDYFRILGRVSDLINVGGQKVYPAEVEDVILALDNVADVAVFGEAHALLGNIVTARVLTDRPESATALKRRIRAACAAVLANYKVPSKVVLADQPLYTARQKKRRA